MDLSTFVLRNVVNKRPLLQSYGNLYSHDINTGLSHLVHPEQVTSPLSTSGIDDRTLEECSSESGGKEHVHKPRWSTVSSFISGEASCHEDLYNDMHVDMDKESLQILKNAGLDESLARHMSQLFLRCAFTVGKRVLKEQEILPLLSDGPVKRHNLLSAALIPRPRVLYE